jgi:hypothetical protein
LKNDFFEKCVIGNEQLAQAVFAKTPVFQQPARPEQLVSWKHRPLACRARRRRASRVRFPSQPHRSGIKDFPTWLPDPPAVMGVWGFSRPKEMRGFIASGLFRPSPR